MHLGSYEDHDELSYIYVDKEIKLSDVAESNQFWFHIYQFCKERNSLQIHVDSKALSYLSHCTNGIIQETLRIIGVNMSVDEFISLA